jgi:NAD-dependent DNA ligase
MTTALTDQIREQHKHLCQQLHFHNYRYHALDAPEISDSEYDQLMQQLLQLERQYPRLLLRHHHPSVSVAPHWKNLPRRFTANPCYRWKMPSTATI